MVKNPHPHPSVGAQLREAYEKTDLSITQLERLSGVSRKYITLAFDGANISLSILEKLAEALGISAIQLPGLESDEKSSRRDADVALATTSIERGLEEAMKGLAILKRRTRRRRKPSKPPEPPS